MKPLSELAYDSIRAGAPGLSDATCKVIAASIARKAQAAPADPVAGVGEADARRRLIACIDQWDGEMEYDAEDRAGLADDILHEFNGPPLTGDDRARIEYLRSSRDGHAANAHAEFERRVAVESVALSIVTDPGIITGLHTAEQARSWIEQSLRSAFVYHAGPNALAPSPSAEKLVGALEDIASERRRQVEVEGWSVGHDDEHDDYQMARAAGCYALSAGKDRSDEDYFDGTLNLAISHSWPWDKSWWKPKDRRRDLIRAGALIVAEIERLDRQSLAQAKGGV